MTGLSLFTGIGGIDLAFEAAGGQIAAMCERDEFCRGILRQHWPNVPVYDDVKTLRGEEIGTIDVIFGGFPCQSFSYAGSRKGKNDDRYLWPEFSRLVREIKPAWVVGENVPGILNLAADDVCEDLERQGYAIGIFMHEAAAVGAPHRRMRVFFVAHSESRRLESWKSQSRGYSEKAGETSDHPAPGSSESSGAVPNSRRGVFTGRSILGTICEECRGEKALDAERPGCAFISNTKSGRRRERTANKGGSGERSESRTWDRFSIIRPALSDPDRSRKLQQEGRFFTLRQRACDNRENAADTHMQRLEEQLPAFSACGKWAPLESAECDRGGCAEPSVGRMADGLPRWLDSSWWQFEPDIPRVAPRGIPKRVQRLKALGNAVVPAQIYPIFAAIAEIHHDDWRDES
jgi:DNA (cytosine-5)-methyltransferase 1